MYLNESENKYGTPVSVHQCDFCSHIFTVCPAASPEQRIHWDGCLDENCESYDESRDADKLFGEGKVQSRPIEPTVLQ